MLHCVICPLDGNSYQLQTSGKRFCICCAAGYFKKAWRSLKDIANPEQNPIDVMIMEGKQ